jgi:murein DD-endopeptidase MepM/ murein hydrolase activator NlpD
MGVVGVLGLALGGTIVAAGCSHSKPPPPLYTSRQGSYTVRRGDTLHRIAQRYGVSVSSLMSANRIEDPRDLQVGQVLVIPGRYSYSSLEGDYSDEHPTHIFRWPVEHGIISSGFGIRHGTMHDGVDIAAPVGTPVHAADNGTVIYSGRLRGYGNVIIIRHDDHYVTVYGHDATNFVREGDSVTGGQVIGKLGDTGRTTGPNLHFEVRRDNTARNPLAYLPRPADSDGISFARNGGS